MKYVASLAIMLFICGIIFALLASKQYFANWNDSQQRMKLDHVVTDAEHTTTEHLQVDQALLRPHVEAFCSACHAMPRPDSFPASSWQREVQRGYDFYFASGRTDLIVPRRAEVTAYFQASAPTSISIPSSPAGTHEISRFVPRPLQFPALPGLTNAPLPLTASVAWLRSVGTSHVDRQSPDELTLFTCDMHDGLFVQWQFASRLPTVQRTAALGHPAHVIQTDLDNDGAPDYVVADLGGFLPEDHRRGRVLWLRTGSGVSFAEPIVLAENLGRVADVEAADFNADGITDLVVAEFGWQTTGNVLLLVGQASEGGPEFKHHVLDNRHGSIAVIPHDINDDGLLDIVALISQEHEKIEVFLNMGNAQFCMQTAFDAGNPAYGSSGIQLADMDLDGDTDIVYTNGDLYDSFELKPYHGIQWIENVSGEHSWKHHPITAMPGVLAAIVKDFNNDGLSDIVACSSIPSHVLKTHNNPRLDSLILLEQSPDGNFLRHPLEQSNCRHSSLCAGDFDGDGSVDFIVGSQIVDANSSEAPLTVWWNNGEVSAMN